MSPVQPPTKGMRRLREYLMVLSLVAGIGLVASAMDEGQVWVRCVLGFFGVLCLSLFTTLVDVSWVMAFMRPLRSKRRWQLKPEYDWWDVTVFILLWVVFVMATPTLIIVTCLISCWQHQGGG